MYRLTAILLSLFLAAVVLATPLERAAEEVWNPRITRPAAGDKWLVGSKQTVSWDTSTLPPRAQNSTGRVLLGYDEGSSENLDNAHPLASGFKLMDGHVTFKVPNATRRDNYIVALFGDSGNISPRFTI
ncbi:hypothetical protein K474DRAFT_1571234, partial [Panus rudis PR-1116 ss-1]